MIKEFKKPKFLRDTEFRAKEKYIQNTELKRNIYRIQR